MAHAVHSRDLGRNSSWRKATVRSLAQALLTQERIRTTRAKAKEAQRLTERLITLGKAGTLTARRRAVQLLGDPMTVRRLFGEVAPRFSQRSGGYTRILHDNFRPGDGASMAVIELVELAPKKMPEKLEKKSEKPAAPKRTATPASEKPAAEKPAAAAEKPEPPKPVVKDKKPGLVEGLRKFLKGRDKSP